LEKDESAEDGLEQMEKILQRAGVGRIALCDGSMPYLVPVNFLYHEKKIAFHCAWEGKKLDLIGKNPNCCFEIDEFMGEVSYHYEDRCHLDYDSVLAFGKARVENDEEKEIRFLQLFPRNILRFIGSLSQKAGKGSARIAYQSVVVSL